MHFLVEWIVVRRRRIMRSAKSPTGVETSSCPSRTTNASIAPRIMMYRDEKRTMLRATVNMMCRN